MPAIAHVMREETPRVLVVLIRHQNAHPRLVRRVVLHILLPDHREEQRPGRVHDGDVRQQPAAVIRLQQLNHSEEERMLRDRSHGVVRDASRRSAPDPRWVSEKRVETTVAAIVQVDIRSPVMRQHKVADRVGALNGVFIVVKGVQKPRVFLGDEVARFLVRP